MQKKTYLAMLALSLALPVASFATDELPAEAPQLMDEVVVTAGRVEQSVARIPAQVTIVTAEQIQESGAQSVPDVLRSLAGVFVSDLNGNGTNQTVDMGGFGESASRHVAVLVDGRRLNPIDLGSVRWSTIALDQIAQIEILHGSGAVLYGDNAMGGVINIITKEAEASSYLAGELSRGSHGASKEKVKGNVQYKRGRAYLEYDHQDTDGYRDRSASDRESVFGKISYDIDPQTYVWADLSVSSVSYQLPGALTEAQMEADRTQAGNPADEGSDDSVSFSLGMKRTVGDGGELSVNLSRQQEDRDSDMASWFSFMTIDTETSSFNTQYSLAGALANLDNHLVMGLDYYDVDYGAWSGAFKGAQTNRFDHQKRSTGLYIKDDLMLTKDILLSAGARYEMPKMELQSDVGSITRAEMDESEWAWDLGAAYLFENGSKIYGRLYRSFRYPAVDEFTNVSSGAVNGDLRQETALGYEAGVHMAAGNNASVDFRLYEMRLDDEIAWMGDWMTGQNENLDETRHVGAELSARYQPLNVLELYGSVTYTKAEFTSGIYDGNEIPLIPHWKTTAGIRYIPRDDLQLGLIYNHVGKRYFGGDADNVLNKFPEHQTVDLSLTYQYSEQVELYVNGTNIFNEEYSDYGWYSNWSSEYNYYPMPEAVYWAGIRVRF